MPRKDHNWILVTGVPRSGTTFVGRVLAFPFSVNLIYEPCNPTSGIPGFEQRYLYLRPDGSISKPQSEKLIKSIFDYTLKLKTVIHPNEAWYRNIAKHIIGGGNVLTLRLAKLNRFAKATVIKDPISCLLTEYLYCIYKVKPVIMIRHPYSLIASVKRLRWCWTLDPVKSQLELVEEYFQDEMELINHSRDDPIWNAACVWRLLNKVLLDQASHHPDWILIKHEELSQRPLKTFKELYNLLDLPWSRRIAQQIRRLTDSGNPSVPQGNRVHDFKRNSPEIFSALVYTLTPSEREMIRDITAPIAEKLYPKESFFIE